MSPLDPRPEAQIKESETSNFLNEQQQIDGFKKTLRGFVEKAQKKTLQGDEAWWDWYMELKKLYALARRSTTYASAYTYNTEAQKLIGAIEIALKESVSDTKRTEIQNLMHTYARIER